MIKVYNAPYIRRYYAPFLSTATVCCFLALAFVVLLPFFLAYGTGQFWIKSNTYYEQPRVQFTGELFIDVSNTTGTVAYCSIQSINQQFGNNVLAPIVESASEDANDDGKNDMITIRAFLPVYNATTVTQVNMIVGLHYLLSETVKIRMVSGIFVSVYAGSGASKIVAVGDVLLRQKHPLEVSSKSISTLYAGAGIFEPLKTGSFLSALKEYEKRNETLQFRHNEIVVPYGGGAQTEIELKLRVPLNQPVHYVPGMVEMLKTAWIQYMYILIPVYFVIYELLLWLVVRFKVVPSTGYDDELLTRKRG